MSKERLLELCECVDAYDIDGLSIMQGRELIALVRDTLSQLEAAKADSERLDWLEKEMKPYFTSAMHEVANTEHFDGRTVREAIDAARASRAQQGGE